MKMFRYALNGIGVLFMRERNARIHLVIFLCVVAAGFFFHLTAFEWIAVILVSGAVFAAEAINTSIEKLADVVSPEVHPQIKIVKDVAAGSVLLAAFTAVIAGLVIFLPKIIAL